jgi:5-oxoprolinase (ATP-hydrolysing)
MKGGARESPKEIGFTQISVSHQVSPLMKLVGRGDTTVVDAYLSPILRRYVDQVAGSRAGRHAADVHAVEWRPDRRLSVPGQGRDPVRPGRRRCRHGEDRAAMAGFARSSASTWAAPRPMCRIINGEYERAFETRSPVCGCARR